MEARYGRRIWVQRGDGDRVEFEPGLGPFTADELGRPPTDAGARDIAVRVAALLGVRGEPILGGITSADPEFGPDGRRTSEEGHVLGVGCDLPGVLAAHEQIGPDIAVTVEISDAGGRIVGAATIGGQP